jgi:putative transposase
VTTRAYSLSLEPGRGVSWNGRNWRIVDARDGDQLLCAPIGGGPRKFLPLQEVGPLLEDDAVAPTDPADVAGPIGAAESAAPRAISKWQKHMQGRRLRELPHESQMSPRERFEHEQDIETFHKCKEILKETDRRVRRLRTLMLAEELGVSESTAYRRVEAVRRYDSAKGLVRAVRSDTGDRRHPEEAMQLLRDALAKHRFIPLRKTVPHIKTLLDGQLKAKGFSPMSKKLIHCEIAKTSRRDQLKSEGRLEQARNEYRTKVGSLPCMDYPLSTVQVDHSPVQLCLVDSEERLPIGDAWLTLVVDCFSRMILGFFISLNAPSTLNYGLALAHAFLPKDKYLQKMNVKGRWPCWGIPDVILVDNAAELNGHMIQRARRRHKFKIRRRPVGQPQFGGHVESVFSTFMDWIKTVNGTKFSNPRERAEYDSEGRAILTINEFEKLFTDFIVNEYHLREHSGEGMNRRCPLQRWDAGIHDGDVMPARGLPEVPSDPEELRISLMPVLEQRVVKQGFMCAFSQKFFSHELASLSDKLDARSTAAGRKFDLRYDPRDALSKVWLDQGPDRSFMTLPNADRTQPPRSLWEHKAQRKRLGRPAAIYDDQRSQRAQRAEEQMTSAAEKTKRARHLRKEKEKRARGEMHRAGPAPKPPASPRGPGGLQPLTPEQKAALLSRLPPAV